MRYQPRTEGVFLIAVIVASFLKFFLSTTDSIGCDGAMTPEPRKQCNWTMVRETLVPDRVTVVVQISLGSNTDGGLNGWAQHSTRNSICIENKGKSCWLGSGQRNTTLARF